MVILSDLIEGSSSSSAKDHKYDVFLSFRGVDTRHSFTDHLHKALVDANITTFLDDEEIETGGDLKPELGSAIKASRASVIVLSKNYANSSWCLDELVLILEQRRRSNQIVIPIFYHVEPTHVRKQESTFGEAMDEHIQKIEAEKNANKRSQLAQKLDRWKRALTEVANLKGKDVNGRREAEFIKEIVEGLYHSLHVPLRTPLPQLIGMMDSIEFVTSWLEDASSKTGDLLAIVGMGGIGKTSLAKYVYGLHCREFQRSSFIEDISTRCASKFNRFLDLQEQLLDDISKRSSIKVHDDSIYISKIEDAVASKKVFLVLDDVDKPDQLDALLGSKGFHSGSKIIITTKNAGLIESCALFKSNIKPKYSKHLLQGLYESGSRQLVCFHAFMCTNPKAGYEDVLEQLVKYCKGHPLALKVLGKSLHNRDVAYWEECIEGLKEETHSCISKALQMSFDSLPSKDDKELFKHIACFFVGIDRDYTEIILKGCGIKTISGITNLIDRCLLNIGWNNKLMMHELLQEMGRSVIREESPDKPWKRSRLWCHEESFKVLKQKKGSGNLLGLALDMRMLKKRKSCASFELKTDALSNMDKLMLLQLNYVQMINGSYENFPEELRWLCMHGFPLKSIPSDLRMENLVALDMSYSNIESFDICYSNPQQSQKRQNQLIRACSKDKGFLGSLKVLNLSFCEQLHSLGGFAELPALENLIVRNCIGLVEICNSIQVCVELVLIDLSYCKKLEKLPRTIGMLKKVKTLMLDGCNLGGSQIEAIPSCVKFFTISLPRSLVTLSIPSNNLYTESFPMDFSCLSKLKELYLDDNPIVSMPDCVRSLPNLELLSMNYCTMLMSVEHPPCTLAYLDLYSVDKTSLQKVVFDRKMSPLKVSIEWDLLAPSSFEIEGMIKIQPIADVKKNVLCSLGWINLEFLNKSRQETFILTGGRVPLLLQPAGAGTSERSEIQMYYEFGIFSTIYGGEEMPNWITKRSKRSISFHIPLSCNKLRGLNFCCVLRGATTQISKYIYVPQITISNITKKRTWTYAHYIDKIDVGGQCLIFLSHWMLGEKEMQFWDKVTIRMDGIFLDSLECGMSFVYDKRNMREAKNVLSRFEPGTSLNLLTTRPPHMHDDCYISITRKIRMKNLKAIAYEDKSIEHPTKVVVNDVLSYYKSWNHIIGGDLSAFQTISGEYILDNKSFSLFKGSFTALSQRKSNTLGETHEDVTKEKELQCCNGCLEMANIRTYLG